MRSLALFRIGLGLVLLWNLYDLSQDLSAYLSDDGLLPRSARRLLNAEEQWTAPPYFISLHMLSGDVRYQAFLCGLSALFAAGVMLGYRTQWSLFVSWILLISLQARNPLLWQGSDDVLRCALFWSMLIPLGRACSLDHCRTREPPRQRVFSAATIALVLQLACIYWSSGMLKSHPVWRHEFTALFYALASDHFSSEWGKQLLAFPATLKLLTAATLALETCGIWLLFWPRRQPQVRLLLVLSFMMFHLGTALLMELGLFPHICIVFWSALLPSCFWESRLLRAILGRLGTSAKASGNATGQATAYFSLSPLGSGLVAILLFYVVSLNVIRLRPCIYLHLNPGVVRVLGDAAQLDQYWCMFCPRPPNVGGWFNLRGTLADGRRVNLLQSDEPVWDHQPDRISATFPSQQWRRTITNLLERNCPHHALCMGHFLRTRWNKNHGPQDQLTDVELIHMQRFIDPAATGAAPVVARVLWSWHAAGARDSKSETSLKSQAEI